MTAMLAKLYCLLFCAIYCAGSFAQTTIPWSSSVNITFGQGVVNPGSPLPVGSSDFPYTTDTCPSPGFYTVVNKVHCSNINPLPHDAGTLFFGTHPLESDSGYMMLINYKASTSPRAIFRDTVKNLCGNSTYLFWAGIHNLGNGTCLYPNLSFNAETLSGQVIQSFQTGDIGGPTDKSAGYLGYLAPDPKTSFPSYYGGIFTLPAGMNEIVVKIIANASNAYADCNTFFAMDNILLTPVGPALTVTTPGGTPEAWVTGACFQGNVPVKLTGNISTSATIFGAERFYPSPFTNSAVQWQQSLDNGTTWTDIPGETNLNLSHVFSIPDTFFIRLRASEFNSINNSNCSVVSNVIKVQVDGLPTGYTFTDNSPVCTDGDLIFNLDGGASYVVTGPNGFYDNSAFSHLYHPSLADSGWYYAQITSFGGCIVTDSVFAKILGPPTPELGGDKAICYGEKIQLHAGGGNKYAWSPPDGLSNINIPNPIASPVTTTKYKVKVTDSSGCSAEGSITVRLLDSILEAGIIGPDLVCPTDIALFKDTSTGTIANWYWNFGNGSTSTLKNPPAQVFTSGNRITNYAVKLIVTDTAGCVDSTYRMLKSVNNCYIAVPSAFTPNGDGLNDYLYPLNAYKATHLTFKIFNRFGQLVFETNDWTKKWDGTVKGYPQPPGAFIWILTYTDDKNVPQSSHGTTVLIR